MPRKYLFDLHSFDPPDPEELRRAEEALLPPPPPPLPTFSEEALAEAKTQAYRQGKQDGFRESEEGISREIHSILSALEDKLNVLSSQEEARQQQVFSMLLDILPHAFLAAFPALSEQLGLSAVKQAVATALKMHEDSKKITITIHPDYMETLQAYISRLYGENHAFITLESDATLARSDCHIAWRHGGIVRDTGLIADHIAQHIASVILAAQQNNRLPLAETIETAQNDKVDIADLDPNNNILSDDAITGDDNE